MEANNIPAIKAVQADLGRLADSMRSVVDSLLTIIYDEGSILEEMAAGNFDVRTKAEDKYVGDFGRILSSMRKINNPQADQSGL